jgi:hypothetical protein
MPFTGVLQHRAAFELDAMVFWIIQARPNTSESL